MSKRVETSVLVVGAGPVGLMTGLLLRRLGVPAIMVERRGHSQKAPAAHVVNARTFEICRQAGVDMDAIAAVSKPPHDAGFTYWVTKLGGEQLGALKFECQGDNELAVTPTPLRNLSQHKFEPILLDALVESGAEPVRYGHRWDSCDQGTGGVTSRISVAVTGESYEVRSRFLVAADGAGSPVRKSLGIEQIGPERLQSFIMIHFAANLRDLVRDCPGVLYWTNDPECRGTFVAHDIDREWVFMHPFEPEQERADSYDFARCEALVRRAIARPDVELEIRTVSPWMMTCQVAQRYREGRVFLAGDAAHRFPPTGGLGLNTGIQDAHNLAWKIAAVLSGSAGEALFTTYERERRPVAQYNAEQSMRNAIRLMEVPAALGFDTDPARAKQAFADVLADSRKRGEVSAAIANQAEHFDMLGLQLGYCYEEGALLDDGSERPAQSVRELTPSSRPGSRLPHGWLERDGQRISSLDLVAIDRLTLIVDVKGRPWIDAVRRLELPVECVRCVRIGADVGDPDRWWMRVAGMSDGGALLVRPDQHVAFRAFGSALSADDASDALARGIAAALSCDERVRG